MNAVTSFTTVRSSAARGSPSSQEGLCSQIAGRRAGPAKRVKKTRGPPPTRDCLKFEQPFCFRICSSRPVVALVVGDN
jgi:hypothetical protein